MHRISWVCSGLAVLLFFGPQRAQSQPGQDTRTGNHKPGSNARPGSGKDTHKEALAVLLGEWEKPLAGKDGTPGRHGGYGPWQKIFARRGQPLTGEEERLQRFWHDYYEALHQYYGQLDRIDWVAYYKNHGYEVSGGCKGPGCGTRINYAPVFVAPTMQWALPAGSKGGAPIPNLLPAPPGADPGWC